MVLCQVYVDNVNAGEQTLYNVNIFGRKKVRIVKIDVKAVNLSNVQQYYTFRLESNILRLRHGNVPYFMFSNNPNQQIGNIHGDIVFDCEFNGNLDLRVLNNDNNEIPLFFQNMTLTLDITDV